MVLAVLAALLAALAVPASASAPQPARGAAQPARRPALGATPAQVALERGSGQGTSVAPEPDLAARSADVPGGLPYGPDVSAYQHLTGVAMDWNAVRRSGVSFTIVKSTEGNGYTNPWFWSDYNGARAAGLVRGTYHFARPALPLYTAVSQADYYLSVAGRSGLSGDLPPILDLEVTGGLTPSQLVAWTQVWLATVRNATGRLPMIYTYPSFWWTAMADSTAFAGYPLWWASYTGTSSPIPVPGGWSGWAIWQYTANGSVPTATGPTDLSVVSSVAALRALSNVSVGSTPPPASDRTPPSVRLYPPAVAGTRATVTWAGADTGTGVASADLYVAVDGGAFHAWQVGLVPSFRNGSFAAGRTLIIGAQGHRYTFVARVRDRAGNASTWSHWQNALLPDPTVPAVTLYPPVVRGSAVTEVWGGSDRDSGVARFDVDVAVDGGPFRAWRVGTAPGFRSGAFAAGSGLLGGQFGHQYVFVARVWDRSGNVSTWSHWRLVRL